MPNPITEFEDAYHQKIWEIDQLNTDLRAVEKSKSRLINVYQSLARVFFETQRFLKHLASVPIPETSENSQKLTDLESEAEELVTTFLTWKPSIAWVSSSDSRVDADEIGFQNLDGLKGAPNEQLWMRLNQCQKTLTEFENELSKIQCYNLEMTCCRFLRLREIQAEFPASDKASSANHNSWKSQ